MKVVTIILLLRSITSFCTTRDLSTSASPTFPETWLQEAALSLSHIYCLSLSESSPLSDAYVTNVSNSDCGQREFATHVTEMHLMGLLTLLPSFTAPILILQLVMVQPIFLQSIFPHRARYIPMMGFQEDDRNEY